MIHSPPPGWQQHQLQQPKFCSLCSRDVKLWCMSELQTTLGRIVQSCDEELFMFIVSLLDVLRQNYGVYEGLTVTRGSNDDDGLVSWRNILKKRPRRSVASVYSDVYYSLSRQDLEWIIQQLQSCNVKMVKCVDDIPWLPVDLWISVMQMLSLTDVLGGCSRVCRSWHIFVYDELLEQVCDVDLTTIRTFPSGWITLQLFRRLPRLKSLDMANVCDRVTSTTNTDFVKCVFVRCPRLAHVDISWNDVDDLDIVSIAKACPLLTTLNISDCDRITKLAPLAQCEQLESLSMCGLYQLVDGFDKLPPSLKHLDVRRCRQVTNECVQQIGERCKGISSLLLDFTRITNQCFEYLRSNMSIRMLSIGGCKHFDDDGLRIIESSRYAPHLQHICVYYTSVTAEGIASLKLNGVCHDLRRISADAEIASTLRHVLTPNECHID